MVISKEKRRLYPKNWKEITKREKEKVGYICQLCKKPARQNISLGTHHIYGLSDHKNLIVLCSRCHLKVHVRPWLVDPRQLMLW